MAKHYKNSYKHKITARLAAVQAMFQISLQGVSPPEVISEFIDYRLSNLLDGLDEEVDTFPADKTFFKKLVLGTFERLQEIDAMIEQTLSGSWSLTTLEPVLKNILRVGIHELLSENETPAVVVISEYVDITKSFFSDQQAAFANQSLDKLAQLIRPSEFNKDLDGSE